MALEARDGEETCLRSEKGTGLQDCKDLGRWDFHCDAPSNIYSGVYSDHPLDPVPGMPTNHAILPRMENREVESWVFHEIILVPKY